MESLGVRGAGPMPKGRCHIGQQSRVLNLGQRGRKSVAELTTPAPLVKVDRPEPPYVLWRDAESEVWRRVVSAVPADWFTGRNIDLLTEYCTTVISCRRLAQLIKVAESEPGDFDVPRWLALLRGHAQQTGRAQALATSMRLSQQSVYSAKAGATALGDHVPGRKKPWEA